MPVSPKIKFLSLFVPNLAEAAASYQSILGISPQACCAPAPADHPFAARGPVVFQLGDVTLALYECDGRTTHTGDVGIGLEADVDATAAELHRRGGQVFWGPKPIDAGDRRLAIGVTADRHFFEIVG